MGADGEEPVYYVISDLHIGGDEQLGDIDFLPELLAFLRRLETTAEPVELVINGDLFGLWEFTESQGVAKFDTLVERYPNLFEQLRATGAEISITLLPGNHDTELAAYEEYERLLAEYNVRLVRAESLTRPLGDRTIHFEHGHRQDPNNRFEDFGNPYEKPLGYYYNTLVTSRAGRLSDRGRYNWLKDVQAVTPTERVPRWLLSKYFYREMRPTLRYALVPVLLLFNVSVVITLLAALDVAGIWTMPVEVTDDLLTQLGFVGEAVHFLLVANAVVVGILLLASIPVYLVLRDLSATIDRFGIRETDLTVDPDEPYRKAARDVFDERPDTAVFCYGHTHRPMMSVVDDRLLVNTGTWLKRLHRRDVVAGLLPPVYYPSYHLCIVRISVADDGGLVVAYEPADKPSPAADEMTLLERLLTLGRAPVLEYPDRAHVTESGTTIDWGE
ncbi:metallophosphoesterase [Natrialba hulunbeirensis JCM 10989]|uniref:Metallophosphoesterase n=1 Tax=Natrialba hulunbeirensis JCM 10989 TaxID=1227493 RepID=M0A947_9EURY|nr:metallophosphoesterase [Natrialba hulunbeirensis]ELY93863.1 metallophosphoesterase [Natrialba hulunbeirensis JCM 10989]